MSVAGPDALHFCMSVHTMALSSWMCSSCLGIKDAVNMSLWSVCMAGNIRMYLIQPESCAPLEKLESMGSGHVGASSHCVDYRSISYKKDILFQLIAFFLVIFVLCFILFILLFLFSFIIM